MCKTKYAALPAALAKRKANKPGVFKQLLGQKILSESGLCMFTRKDLQRLIVPLIIEQILAVTIGMADTVMVSGCGEAAVSGVSLVDSINVLLINIFSALATGGAVVASQYLGKRDTENACIAAKQLLYSTTALAAFLMLISLIFRDGILRGVFGHIEQDVMDNAQTYFWLSALSYPFLAIYNAGAALFRSMGNSKVSMYTSILMNLINVGGNALLIFGFQMGTAGAATASLVSRMVGAVIMVLLLRNPHNEVHVIKIFRPEFHWGMVKNILRIGVPNGLENSMFQVGKLLVQSLVASFGTAAIAANAVAGNLASVELIPGNAIGLAIITVIGQCVGARDYTQAKRYAKKLLGVTYVILWGLSLAVMLSSNLLVGMYQLPAETSAIATQLILYHSICAMVIWPASFTLPNVLRAANDVKYTMIVSIASMWSFRIGLSYLLGQGLQLGVLGVWIAMTADWLFRAILFLIRFLRGKWTQKQLI